jgi:WD40 repeat protein
MKSWPFLLAAALPLSAATVDYEKQLFPLLKDNCLPCHNKTTTKGGLNMETVDLMLQGGDNGPALLRGDGAKSLLYQASAGEWDSEMPPKNNKVSAVPLTPVQLALLKQWIDEGAHHSGRQDRVISWEPLPPGFAPIYAAALSTDGQFAAAARGNQVSIYHLPTGSLVTRLTDPSLIQSGLYKNPGVAHRDVTTTLAFSPDGQRLVTGSFREVKVWKRIATPAVTGKTQPPPAPRFKVTHPQPDTVALFDPASNAPLRQFKHGAAVHTYTLSPDSLLLATAGADSKLKLWNTATGELIRECSGDSSSSASLARASLAAERASLESAWWTERVQKTEKEAADLDARLKKARELDAAAQKSLAEKRQDAQAKNSALSQADAALKAADARLAPPPSPQAPSVNPAPPSEAKPDEALVKARSAASETATKAAEAARAAQEALTRAQSALTDAAKEIELVSSLKSRALESVADAKASLEKARNAQDAATAAKAAAAKSHAEALSSLRSLVFSPDATQIAALDASGTVRSWAVASGLPVLTHQHRPSLAWTSTAGPALSSAPIPDPSRSQWILERTLGSGDAQSPITDRANTLAFSPDGLTLAVGSGEPSRSGDITLWQIAGGSLKARWDEVHLDSVLSLDFSPDARHLASGGADKALRVLDTSSGKVVKVFEGHTHHVLGVSWRADGRLLASAGADNVVKIWDWTTGERRQNIAGWDKEVTAVRYLGASDTLVTTSGDAKLRILSSAGAEVRQLPGAIDFQNTLGVTPAGDWLVAGGHDGILRWWNTRSPAETGAFTSAP